MMCIITKKGKFRAIPFIIVSSLLVMLVFVGCATVTKTTGALDPKYHPMLQQPATGERVIDSISVDAWSNRSEGATNHSGSWPIRTEAETRTLSGIMAIGEKDSHTPHSAPAHLDRLIAMANESYPGETLILRNATQRCRESSSTATRQVVVDGQVRNQNYQVVTCQVFYSADIVVAAPMPQPVTHSSDITVEQTPGGNILSVDGAVIGQVSLSSITRADLYRRAHNYLTDTNHRTADTNVDFQAIEFQSADIDLGRIRGVYTFVVNRGRNYRMTSTFTIDVHDSKATIAFSETSLRRPGSNSTERIFLQSIADLAKGELEKFSNSLITSITQ